MCAGIRVGIVQHNPTVGDIDGNYDQLQTAYDGLQEAGADIVVMPELAILGYPPRDLLFRSEFLTAQNSALDALAAQTSAGPPIILGAAAPATDDPKSPLQNTATVLSNGAVKTRYAKRLLPTYGVFDEDRYFIAGSEPAVVSVNGIDLGLSVCEDAWHDMTVAGRQQYRTNPIADVAAESPDLIVNISASPFSVNKPQKRYEQFEQHAVTADCPIVLANQVGGNDDLVYDGHSFLIDRQGQLHAQLPGFEPAKAVVELSNNSRSQVSSLNFSNQQIRSALRLGIRDYFAKTGFSQAVIGMSGGIDSSVTTALAVDALGADHVYGISMPSEITSEQSITDARTVASRLGIEFDVLPIKSIINAIQTELQTHLNHAFTDVAFENIQARVRGAILMGFANELNALVLTPDNKSEGAVGYCTLYGDTVGALAPLGDCYKHMVYDLAEQVNHNPPDKSTSPVIPKSVFEKPPTAELAEDQSDRDDLPPYDVLDPILQRYIEDPVPSQAHVRDKSHTQDVIQRIVRSEFKRWQTPPALRVTKQAFNRDWRYPIAASFRPLTKNLDSS